MARSERFRHPGLVIGGSFTAAIAAGTLLLWLPVAAASGQRTGFVDAIFTATSAREPERSSLKRISIGWVNS